MWLCLMCSHFGFSSDCTCWGRTLYILCQVILGLSCLVSSDFTTEESGCTVATPRMLSHVPQPLTLLPMKHLWKFSQYVQCDMMDLSLYLPVWILTNPGLTSLVDCRQQVKEMKVLQQAHACLVLTGAPCDHWRSLIMPLIMLFHAGQQQLITHVLQHVVLERTVVFVPITDKNTASHYVDVAVKEIMQIILSITTNYLNYLACIDKICSNNSSSQLIIVDGVVQFCKEFRIEL